VPDDYSTIQAAVDAALPDCTIVVRDGIYTESVDVNKPLTIRSENGSAGTIVQASAYDHVFEVAADRVIISGFTVRGVYVSGIFATGVYLYGAECCSIANNRISGSVCGVYLKSSSANTITGNIISDNPSGGISLVESSDRNRVVCNTISGISNPGIELFYSNQNVLLNNTVSNSFCGVDLVGSTGNQVYLNNFTDNSINTYSADSSNTWHSTTTLCYAYGGKRYTNHLGNHWSDYGGSDFNGDGIGDTAYSIGSDEDGHPLMEPFDKYTWIGECLIYLPLMMRR